MRWWRRLRKLKQSKWSDALTQIAIDMRKEGHSSLQIGKAIGMSRCAVIGRLRRLRIKPPTRVRTARIAKLRAKLYSPKIKKVVKVPIVKVVPRYDPPPPTNDPVTLLNRTKHQCAYMVGRQMMCGAPTFYSSGYMASWCEFHFNICYKRKDAA